MANAPKQMQKRHVREKATITTTSSRTSTGRSRLMRNTLPIAPRHLPACRSKIRFARNGTPVRVAFPLSDE